MDDNNFLFDNRILNVEYHPLRVGDHISRSMELTNNFIYHHGIVSQISSDPINIDKYPSVDEIYVIHWIGGYSYASGYIGDVGLSSNDKLSFKETLDTLKMVRIKETSLREFMRKSDTYYIHHHPRQNCRSREKSIQIARIYLESDILDNQYNFFIKNCEGFVLQCVLNIPMGEIPISSQFKVGIGIALGTAALATLAKYCPPNILELVKDWNSQCDDKVWKQIITAGGPLVNYIEKELFGVVPKTPIRIRFEKERKTNNYNPTTINEKDFQVFEYNLNKIN
jgi:hypothetical protein